MTKEEAIKRIKARFDKLALDDKDIEAIQTLIPELCESADEKVRKALIQYLKDYPCNLPNGLYSRDDFFTYLKKQKEQKTLSTEETKLNSIPSLEQLGYTCVPPGAKQKPILKFKVGDKIHLIDGTSPNYEDDCITIREIDTVNYIGEFKEGYVPIKEQDKWELVKEQNPAECLKAERDGWYVCIKDYYCGGKKQCAVGNLVQAKGGMYMMGEENISEWFRRAYYEEVRDAFEPNADTNIPEQPAEWSEEDEWMLLSIINAFRNGTVSTIGQEQWLKSLPERFNLQPKQEWSEEDESQLDDIEKAISNYYDLNHAPQYHYWLEQKLKSFRPQIIDSTPLYTVEQVDEKIRKVQEKMLGGVYSSYDMAKMYVEGQNNILTNLDKYRPSWKPSEEQKKIIGNIRHLIFEHAFENGGVDVNGDYCKDVYQEADDFLKSLRPKHHWKPSEEQMQALINCIIGDDYDIHALVSLASDLKNYII